MCPQKQRNICRYVPNIFLLMAFSIALAPLRADAENGAGPSFSIPTGYKKYHVHYDLNADGTYTELDDLVITVLNERGVLHAKNMPVGMPHFGPSIVIVRKRDIEILQAYTLKQNGQRTDAIQPSQQEGLGAAASAVLAAPALPPMQMKIVAFQSAEVGDTLVLSYKVTQREPILPNTVVLEEAFPKFVPYDDVVISLTAPSSLHLRLVTAGIGDGENSSSGDTQKWIWKYENKEPQLLQPNQPPSFGPMPLIHISSFEDNEAEMEAINKLLLPFRPLSQREQPCMLMPGIPNDGPDAINMYAEQVAGLFWTDANYLKLMVDGWNSPSCEFDDGRPRMSALGAGYNLIYKRETDWSKSLARIDELRKKLPDTPIVALAEARYWSDYAWNARGSGFASSVTREGWTLFHERLEKEERVLIATKPYAAEFPGWYDEMIIVQSALDRPAEDRDKTFLEGTQKFRTYYPIYFTMVNYISPKWGGSWETVDNMIKWSVENSKATDGNSMYARLYWFVDGELPEGVKLFKDTLATWPKMKKGFEDLVTRHPKSKWNLNNFARFACMAGDKKTFLALRRQISKDVMDAAWSQNTSLDLCEKKFGYSQ